MGTADTDRDALRYALRIAGSAEELAARLGVGEGRLAAWLSGCDEVPVEIFLKVVDLLLEASRLEVARSRSFGRRGRPDGG